MRPGMVMTALPRISRARHSVSRSTGKRKPFVTSIGTRRCSPTCGSGDSPVPRKVAPKENAGPARSWWSIAAPMARARFEAVNACLVLLATVADAEIWTVEGVGKSDALHPVQRALAEAGGSQCGYCTPGFVMAFFANAHRAPPRELTQSFSGNLCRCTGYRPIREAARVLPVLADDDRFVRRLAQPVRDTVGPPLLVADVAFDRPTRLEDALFLRAQDPEARVVAGGTDVVVEL